jgi:hypothetical protein
MAYTINLTDGTIFATIPDGTVNTSSSMTLIGKNYAGYGQFLDDNFIHLLENSSNTTAPGSPIVGQLWWDSGNTRLNIYTGGAAGWKPFAANTASGSAPSNNTIGDLWFDTTNQQLKVATASSTFLVVGPAYSSATGTAGAIPETINDAGSTPHFVTSIYVNNVRVAIFSKDASFIPSSPTSVTYPTIYPGVTLNNSLSAVYAGTATNASLLNSLASSQFMRSDATTSTTGTLSVLNNTGLFVGSGNVLNLSATSTEANVNGTVSGGNVNIRANVGGTNYLVAQALGGTGAFAISNAATVGTTLNVTGNTTGGNILTSGVVSAGGNVIGANFIGNVIPPAGGAVSTTGNVTGGNVNATTRISAGGNIVAGGNVSGTYILGDGGLLSNISAAVSVSQIQNGTSNAKIGTTGGNLSIGIGGVANVVIIDTSTIYTNVVSVNSIAKSGTNAVGNIGSTSNYFNQVFATATTALYADVAERFAADEILEAGTVVELGGSAEITRSCQELSENVFGVISTRPAYTMNGGAGDDDTHPKVAMTGRVPVKVTGVINKGDRLVSAGNGLARAAKTGEATAFNTLGRSLESKNDSSVGTVEAIVTIK